MQYQSSVNKTKISTGTLHSAARLALVPFGLPIILQIWYCLCCFSYVAQDGNKDNDARECLLNS